MDPSPSPEPRAEFPLRRRGRSLRLDPQGLVLPGGPISLGSRSVPYAVITHIQLGTRTLRIATRRGVVTLSRRSFADAAAPEALVRALLERVVLEPGGAQQLARMAEVEEIARSARPARASAAVALLCVAVAAAGFALGPAVHEAGLFSASLVRHGEPWRLVTANFLHALFPLHLGMNLLGLLGIGLLVERPLGSLRTLFVLGISALGAMATSLAVDYENLVGASGMVAGLAGALLWLELRHAERLPAFWRVPRRLLLAVLALEALVTLAVPMIAGAAHAGGFLAGLGATALVAGPHLHREEPTLALRVADGLLVGIAAAALATAAPLALSDPHAWSRHAERLLHAPDVPPVFLNDTAWILATGKRPRPLDLERALELAERAVLATEGRDPNVLDTLAEVQFRRGRTDAALATIERAIALAPQEPYFREQRRRYRGERAADDLPPPPRSLPTPVVPAPEPAPEESPGVRA